jgi:aminoglycoside/choline kinase family phosphotransferase
MTLDRRDPSTTTRERVRAYLERTGLEAAGARVVPLTGDASDRRYLRILAADRPSQVLAVYAEPFEYSRLPFVNVAELLQAMPVPIPAIVAHQADLGILALEDLGDVTLQAHLGSASATDHAALYREAVELVAVMQRRGAELASPRFLPYGVAFDTDKLAWELDFFAKHFLEAYRGASVSDAARSALAAEFAPIVEELAQEPRVLCHRDYHSRNLMWHRDRLFMIDFQDARLGPDTYDLASLLRDSYVDISDQSLDELIAYFLATQAATGQAREFRRRFDLMALQRNLKALGTFGYQTTARRNPVYIQYIPRTLRYIRDNLERYPRFERLRALLAEHLDELK